MQIVPINGELDQTTKGNGQGQPRVLDAGRDVLPLVADGAGGLRGSAWPLVHVYFERE